MVENNALFDIELSYEDSCIATPRELISSLKPMNIKQTTTCAGGPVLYRNGDIAYTDPSELHSMVIGDTGSTKTLRYVLPLIRSCAYAGESMLIIDPKGTLHKESRTTLEKCGYEHIHVVNFRDPEKSTDKWNPLEPVAMAMRQRIGGGKDLAYQRLADILDTLFFQRTAAKTDPYWVEITGQFALGICQAIIELGNAEAMNMNTIIRLRNDEEALKGICEKLKDKAPEACAAIMGVIVMEAHATKSCILSTFDQLTRLFSMTPKLTQMLSKQSFSFLRMGREKTAIFVVIPDEKTTYHLLAQLMINQCYMMLLESAEKTNGTLKNRVNFILEEFCNLPKMEDILPMLSAARSRNIRLHLVIQSYGQMIEKYGEQASRAIMDNCGNWIYLHTREYHFLEYISDVVGKDRNGRRLLSPSQLQHLDKSETLILHDRCYPIVVRDVPLIFEYGT